MAASTPDDPGPQRDGRNRTNTGTARQDGSRRWRPNRETMIALLVSALFTLPVWLGTHPPMLDYPQHLSMASILRWYHDPARHLVENYTLEYTRPNTAFVYLVAALSYIMPLGLAGKLLMAISVAAIGPAGLALARRAGRPGWFGLFALLSAYDFAFFFGFVNNVIATPLLLYGVVLIDRLLDQPMGWRSWLIIALYGCAFYFVHIQFLFLFAGVVGWLTLTRFPGWRNSLWIFSALSFGVAMTLLHYFLRHEETYTYKEKGIYAFVPEMPLIFDKVIQIPDNLFGTRAEGEQWLLFLLAVLVILRLCQVRARSEREIAAVPAGGPSWGGVSAFLVATRFYTLAAWFLGAYLLMPHGFVGLFVYQRLIAVAWLMLPAVLPVPEMGRLRLAKVLVGITIVTHLVLTGEAAYAFHLETRGGHDLIAKTKPGKNLMSLVLYYSSSVVTSPLLLHFGAHYLAEKGGRINSSFSELHISMVQMRPDLGFDDLHASVNEFVPWRFRFDDFGYHFDYFLFRGNFGELKLIFGKHLSKLAWETRDDWMLLWRKDQVAVVH
jgi:hypothetical protein